VKSGEKTDYVYLVSPGESFQFTAVLNKSSIESLSYSNITNILSLSVTYDDCVIAIPLHSRASVPLFDITLGDPSSEISSTFTLFKVPCVLEGTTVLTPKGYIPIESIKEGDEIFSQFNVPVKVLKVGKWLCEEKTKTPEQIMYKIPKGFLDAKADVFLSKLHKVVYKGWLRYPATVGLELAQESEYAKNGKYVLYHLKVEDGRNNYLVVNGGCLIESWT